MFLVKLLFRLTMLVWKFSRDLFLFGRRAVSTDLKSTFAKQKTCFILGAGPSINLLSAEDFAFMRKSVTIGVNDFALHPSQADIYSLEVFRNLSRFESRLGVVRSWVNKGSVLTMKSPPNLRRALTLRKLLKNEEFHINYPLTFEGETTADLYRNFKWFRLISSLGIGKMFVYNQASSVVRMAIIAAEHGVKTVALLGVDLEGVYFWQEWQTAQEKEKSAWGIRGGKIANERMAGLPLSKVLDGLSEMLRRQYGCELVWIKGSDLRKTASKSVALSEAMTRKSKMV